MKIIRDEAYERFQAAAQAAGWKGMRIKDVRDRTLTPGGRTELTLFEKADDEGRAHPRLTTAMPPARDPSPPARLFTPPKRKPRLARTAEKAIVAALEDAKPLLDGADLDAAKAPKGSERYWRSSIRAQRTARFFAEARAAVADWSVSQEDALYLLRVLEDEAFAGALQYDDSDTGTYHSFGHDAPFVHYLEAMLKSLPEPGTTAFALLPPEQQEAIRRQRDQARNHLDHLMRHKYAYDVIEEMDCERTLGGLLIDRRTRNIASERPDSRDSLQPQYELLRVDPGADHPHAGAFVYRDAKGGLHLQDGTAVEVDARHVRSIPLESEQLTFLRAPGDARLREGLRFDWDGNGYVQAGRIDWVSWAGHCDIKAIMEQLGVTLADGPKLVEYRSDSDDLRTYDRDLLLEMVASAMELGSIYRKADGSGDLQRGVHRFGGARNDSRPDRLQFKGPRTGESFRWPLAGRQESFVVKAIEWPDGAADMATVFHRDLPDLDKLDFRPNPRYQTTVEGDYNVIDVSGAKLQVDLKCPTIDPSTGYLREERRTTEVDLTPAGAGKRYDLGTHVDDPAQRRIFRVYLDREKNAIVAELDQYVRIDGKYEAKNLPNETITLPMVQPLTVTLSREMRLDDPAAFQALLGVALREAQNICADTDMKEAVWNGVVTRIDAQRVAIDRDTRVERWTVDFKARFGSARLDYLLRRDEQGEPVAYCPVPSPSGWDRAPDFLWQDFPDVGSKGLEGRDWVVNRTMWERGIVSVDEAPEAPGGFYVHDEHIKNVYEIVFAALGGYPFSVVHGNKRYGFVDEATWNKAVKRLRKLRAAVKYVDDRDQTLAIGETIN